MCWDQDFGSKLVLYLRQPINSVCLLTQNPQFFLSLSRHNLLKFSNNKVGREWGKLSIKTLLLVSPLKRTSNFQIKHRRGKTSYHDPFSTFSLHITTLTLSSSFSYLCFSFNLLSAILYLMNRRNYPNKKGTH